MPKDYTYRGHGVNKQGNHYCSRNYGPDAPNQNPYHYSNKDGSWYYKNPNGSSYHDNGAGRATYTTPDGARYTRQTNPSQDRSTYYDSADEDG
ncbi:hypothetical protein F5Y17DRAFT_133630 [Xylariaceae sp. FL0594]|nr:hypothetical protein F5Y17DRAFT_133630 [Xylariaceae sp. FL0594]